MNSLCETKTIGLPLPLSTPSHVFTPVYQAVVLVQCLPEQVYACIVNSFSNHELHLEVNFTAHLIDVGKLLMLG